ncbi:relaxase/mobilization nuclease domain-containing protein [Labilibaculum sp. DW002]|uniref:Relaxase/mobilization nuclease domain-containing protein n=1 Tax=Paralabilibaculum antarcticum TaxID=2912572 RepID=A0ABT5VR65_9BACT|nr:relaxase/mobilization nuclease domain-containing protein [Labilibaculum sp. DW002]MDE5417918.1 relaxase/mobilization nuclease domain-containing protein [Labilibaculum sp. DW002]
MIAKIVQGSGFKGAVNYVLEKKDAHLLYGKGVRLKDKASIIQSFITQSKMKPNISKPVAHISLDFSAQDKARLTNQFMTDMAQEYLKKMGYENTQYIIVRHFDTEHPHIHLMINRIDNNGNRISDKKEKLRNSKICMELTKKYGLYIASGKENVKEHRLREPDKSKYEIYRTLQLAIPKSRNWKELENELWKSEISIELRKNGSTNKIQGVLFSKNGYKFNGSKVDRSLSYSKINLRLQQNEWSLNLQSKPSYQNKTDTTSKHALLKDLVNTLNSTANSEYDAGLLKQKFQKQKKRKKGLRR